MFAIDLRSGKVAAAVFAVAAAAVTLMSGVASAAPYSYAPVTEYMLLPKFCWGHFSEEFVGADYGMPKSCGVGMNHYCDGLLALQMSKKARNPTERRRMLVKAKDDTLYTIGWMKQVGTTDTCPMASHVQQTLQETELQFQIWKIK